MEFRKANVLGVIENEHANESKLRIMGFRIPSRYFDQAAVTIGDDIVWSVWEGSIEAWVNSTPGSGDREDRPQTTLTAHEVAIILDPRQSWHNLALSVTRSVCQQTATRIAVIPMIFREKGSAVKV